MNKFFKYIVCAAVAIVMSMGLNSCVKDLDVEPIDTPQGDLPKTGVAPSAVFFGIGAACVVFGGAIVLKLRRKEEM